MIFRSARQLGNKVLGGVISISQKTAGFAAKAAPALASINPELGVAAAAAGKLAEGVGQAASAIKTGKVGGSFSQGANLISSN